MRPPIPLVVRAAAGDDAAFEDLVRFVSRPLYAFLVVRLGDEDDALDVAQDALLAAWQGLKRLSTPEKFWPWLLGIAIHKATDRARLRGRLRASEAVLDGSESEGRTVESEDDLTLRSAIDRLPARLRDVLLLHYVVGLSETETASALGVRVGTVKSRGARARQRIARALADPARAPVKEEIR